MTETKAERGKRILADLEARRKTQEEQDEAQRLFLSVLVEKGYRFMFKTILMGRPYVWVSTPDKQTIFLERIPDSDAY